MNMPYTSVSLPVRDSIQSAHQQAITAYGSAGTWLDGQTRTQVLTEVRHAVDCQLCHDRKSALSPYALDGTHDTATELPEIYIEVIHRIRTDSGRLTEAWLKRMLEQGLEPETYIELVGLIATSIIIDSFGTAMGSDVLPVPEPSAGEPSRQSNPGVFDGGAWLPMLDVAQEATAIELPTSPNIFRAMGLVPGAIEHFFGVMRAHYGLTDLPFDITRSQTELLASRVSALNQCFY